MIRKILTWAMAVIVMFSIYQPQVVGAEIISQGQWKKSVTGSAGVLEGKAVLVSIFIDDLSSKWSKDEKAKANKKVCAATRYISNQASRYGKKVSIAADVSKHADIQYHTSVKMNISSGERSQERLYRKLTTYINESVDLTAIRKKYGTDSVGFLFHVDRSGVSSTKVHYVEDGTKNFYEAATLFSKFKKQEEGASTYAHEMLHLFGARDLYEVFLADRITNSFVKYIGKKFPNDIMYTTYASGGRQLKYKITNKVSRVTAYFLGWRKTIPEVKRFALPAMKQKGCFYAGTEL